MIKVIGIGSDLMPNKIYMVLESDDTQMTANKVNNFFNIVLILLS